MQRGTTGDGKTVLPDRDQTSPITFASSATGPQNIDAANDMVLDNGGTISHTVTCTIRGAGNTFTRQLPPKTSLVISGQGVQGVALDTTDSQVTGQVGPRGSVYPFHSAPGAALALLAPSVTSAGVAGGNFIPNANNASRMFGAGAALTITPKASGVVLVSISCDVSAVAGAPESGILGLRFGTGTPPVANAGAAGTAIGTVKDFIVTLGNKQVVTLVKTVSGLTLGTAVWFDAVGALSDATGNDVFENIEGFVTELPA